MDWNHTWQKYSLQGPYQVLLLSEQKVTTIDQNLVSNISAKYGSNPSSGS
jgi:hypothetical protein